jgi:hypothetical protein
MNTARLGRSCAETSSRAALAGNIDATTAPVALINVLYARDLSSCSPEMRMSAAGWAVWSVSSSLERLQVGDDILAILGIGNHDEHLGPMYISRRIGEIFVELLLVPCDVSGFESG